MEERTLIGRVSEDIIERLHLDARKNAPIYISENNIAHIREVHPDAYRKYFDDLADIIAHPDYIGIAGVQAASIEYVKQYKINDEYVNVAVRATSGGVHYVRSMFIIEDGRLNDYIQKGKLQKYQEPRETQGS